MPGILPMKVIKVGTNSQARIAQACDRCRSKKIRCDGIRPCCSQCANVGFECKTSDKLSRRAFPRGYTESLEDRVRSLETEVRELKDLLDEKDEKIDMLSRIHSKSSQLLSPRRPSTVSVESGKQKVDEQEPDEVFKVQQSPYLLGEGTDSYFAGTSSGRTFIEAFKHKVQESGRSTSDISTELLLASSLRKVSSTPLTSTSPVVWKAPPRLLSDQLVNVFFQEWAPLFPVLHRPTFLNLYENYVADSDSVVDKAEIATLNLVFGVAALSSGTRSSDDLDSFELQWKTAIDSILTETSMSTLQALILAQISCIQQGDLTRLLTYKGLSTSLSARLGLHQSQKRFALGTLTCETRKKVFWTLYTVDCFSSVTLGLPKHIKDDDVHCEYPVDADDEYVTERGFQPTLPGECTKLSSALALFRSTRILSRVLEEVYPARASYELSLKKLSELSDELDAWHTALPPHLRLQFAQDKPSTGTISSRSPLLSLTYHYTRALIHRPAICANIGTKSSSSLLAIAGSCKHMVQIVQLLEERGMCFSFCLNKDEVLVLSGIGLLFQRLRLDPSSKILKDNQKMVSSIIEVLGKSDAPCLHEFKKVTKLLTPEEATPAAPSTQPSPSKLPSQAPPQHKVSTHSRHNSDGAVSHTQSLQSSTKKQLKAIASRFTASAAQKSPTLAFNDSRRATVPSITLHPSSAIVQSEPSLPIAPKHDTANVARSEPTRSPNTLYSRPPPMQARPPVPSNAPILKPKKRTQTHLPNLDYLSFGGEPVETYHQMPSATSAPIKTEPQPTDWEKLLGSLDNGPTNIFDACYGGQPVQALMDSHNTISPPMSAATLGHSHANVPAPATSEASLAWNPDLWALCQANAPTASTYNTLPSNPCGTKSHGEAGHAPSVWSFSSGTDDGLGSVEDLSNTDWASTSSNSGGDAYRAIVLPDLGHADDLGFGASVWDAGLNFGA